MKEKKAKQLLGKYLSGAATPQEKKLVDEWYQTIEFTEILGSGQKQQLGALAKKAIQAKTRPGRLKLNRLWIQAAAAAVILIVLGTLWFNRHTTNETGQKLVVITSSSGTKLVALPDGSIVTLHANSTLAYPKQFTPTSRQVFLREGSAFFDVRHDEKNRFTVETSTGLAVKVLGTSFLVSSFAKQKDISISVSTGKVAIQRQQKNLAILSRGDRLVFDRHANTFRLAKNTELKSVPIHFNGATISQVVKRLSYIYNIELKLDPSVDPQLRTTAQFNSSLSISELLELICKLHKLNYRIAADQQSYVLYK